MNPFALLKQSQGLIPFFVLGDPDIETSFAIIKTAIDAGANALELGLPFSDPVADGPVIQRATARALSAGMNFNRALILLARIRSVSNIPINILTYANPLYQQGYDISIPALKNAGADGILVADMAFEATVSFSQILEKYHLTQSFLIGPNTAFERACHIHARATAFTYLVNRLGTTGLSEGVPETTLSLLQRLHQLNSDVPIAVGFGIHTPEQAKTLFANGADAVIIGSKMCQLIEENTNLMHCCAAIRNYIVDFKEKLS